LIGPDVEASTLLNRGLVIWKEAAVAGVAIGRALGGDLGGRPRIL